MRTCPDFKKVCCAVVLLAGLTGVVCLSGCKPDKETRDQMEALKTELANVQPRLDEAAIQAEASKLNLEALARTLAQTQEYVETLARLQKETGATDAPLIEVKAQLAEVVSQRDAAMTEAKETRAMLEQLQGQLAGQIQKTAALAEQIADLRQTLAPPVEETPAAAEEGKPKSDAPIVGFPESPGFKD
jgi:chromosome segregation ATPase